MPAAVAYFISSHGFGHAARACGVIGALWRQAPDLRVELFTATPAWFFEDSLRRPVTHHAVATDSGLVQANALEEDLGETIARLRAETPFPPARVDELAARVADRGCGLVICDIAPIGLLVARHLGLPSVLIENFTWDWIYRAYGDRQPELEPVADYLAGVFAAADVHVQTEPLCRTAAGALRVAPVSRAPRQDRAAVRRELGVPEDAGLVMVTMGGFEWRYDGIDSRLAASSGGRSPWLVVPGASREPRRCGRAVLLPHRSKLFHPDLIAAADAVVGKLGYSTLAEVHRAGVPFGYVPRPRFPESPPLESWVRAHLPHRRIDPRAFMSWGWLDDIDPLLELDRRAEPVPDGGDEAARIVLRTLARP